VGYEDAVNACTRRWHNGHRCALLRVAVCCGASLCVAAETARHILDTTLAVLGIVTGSTGLHDWADTDADTEAVRSLPRTCCNPALRIRLMPANAGTVALICRSPVAASYSVQVLACRCYF
jgi:hypothetical protein